MHGKDAKGRPKPIKAVAAIWLLPLFRTIPVVSVERSDGICANLQTLELCNALHSKILPQVCTVALAVVYLGLGHLTTLWAWVLKVNEKCMRTWEVVEVRVNRDRQSILSTSRVFKSVQQMSKAQTYTLLRCNSADAAHPDLREVWMLHCLFWQNSLSLSVKQILYFTSTSVLARCTKY